MPALDHNKNIGNYQFSELAISCNVAKLRKEALMNEISLNKAVKGRPVSIPLCDINMNASMEDQGKYHAIIFWSRGQSTFEFTDKDFTLRDLMVRFYKKRGQSAPVTSAFYFEHEDNQGVPINIHNKVLNYNPPVFTLHIEYNDLQDTTDSSFSQLLSVNKHHHFFQGTIIVGKHKHYPVHVRVENKTIEYLPQSSAKSSLKRANAAHPPEPAPITIQIASIISIEDTPYRKIRNFQLVVVKHQEDKRTNKVTVLFKKEDADEFVKVLQAMQQSLKSFAHSTII